MDMQVRIYITRELFAVLVRGGTRSQQTQSQWNGPVEAACALLTVGFTVCPLLLNIPAIITSQVTIITCSIFVCSGHQSESDWCSYRPRPFLNEGYIFYCRIVVEFVTMVYHYNYCVSEHYPRSPFLFKTQKFSQNDPVSFFRFNLLSWEQSMSYHRTGTHDFINLQYIRCWNFS